MLKVGLENPEGKFPHLTQRWHLVQSLQGAGGPIKTLEMCS